MPAFFHNRLLMLVLMLSMGLGFASSVYAETVPASVEAVEKLQDRVIELEKETAVLKAELGTRIDAQDNRIADGIGQHGAQVTLLSNQTTYLGNLIQWFAMGIAVLGLVGGFFAFLRAEKLAKKRIDEWFESNETALQERIENLGHVAVDALNSRAEEITELMEQTRQGVHDRAVDIYRGLEQVEAAMLKGEKPSAEVVKQVEQEALNLDAKPRSQWTVDDLYNSGVYSYTAGEYDRALTRLDSVINMLVDGGMLSEGFHPDLFHLYSKAQFFKGLTLGKIGRLEDSLSVLDSLLKEIGDTQSSTLKGLAARTMFNKAVILGELKGVEEELAIYDELISKFSGDHGFVQREAVAFAWFNSGAILTKLGRLEDALVAYESLVALFSDSDLLSLRERVADGLLNKGSVLARLKRFEEEIEVYGVLIELFGASSEYVLRERVADALLNKGASLRQMERFHEAIATYDELVSRFGNSVESGLRDRVANGLFNKGFNLNGLNRTLEAREAFNEVINRFSDSAEPNFLRVVERARRQLGDVS